MRRICTRSLFSRPRSKACGPYNHNDGVRVPPKLIGYMAERREHRERWVGALQNTTIPVRLIDGLEDPISGAHMVERYRELVPAADVVELSGVGHYPQVEAPQDVAEAAMTFRNSRSTVANLAFFSVRPPSSFPASLMTSASPHSVRSPRTEAVGHGMVARVNDHFLGPAYRQRRFGGNVAAIDIARVSAAGFQTRD